MTELQKDNLERVLSRLLDNEDQLCELNDILQQAQTMHKIPRAEAMRYLAVMQKNKVFGSTVVGATCYIYIAN